MTEEATWPLSARHCLRVGSLSDKKVIEASKSQFDVLVVQGNLAISAPQALATWQLDKPIWIDPITYAFAAHPAYLRSSGKAGGYKKTFLGLAEAFGHPYEAALAQDRPLTPGDFTETWIAESVARVVDWQETIFAPPENDLKYGAEPKRPTLLTIPFFPLTLDHAGPDVEPSWLRTNLAMIREATASRQPTRLAAGFLADLDVFDHERFETWLTAYADALDALKIRDLWWWISDNDEIAASLQRVTRMLRSFRELTARGIRVHQAFGGSLSSFALTHGLTSVAHGVNYWESKGWEPITSGGLPSARYFHPGLRERLRVPEAIAIVDHRIEGVSDFYDHVCACEVCAAVVKTDVAEFGAFGEVNIKTRRTRGGGAAEFDSPTARALFLTKSHYLHAKSIEVDLATSDGFNASEQLLREAAFWASDVTRTRHLDRWAVALAAGDLGG